MPYITFKKSFFHYSYAVIFFIFSAFFSMLTSADNSFDFITLGDTAYTEKTYNQYTQLIKKINKQKPAFSIHVGDTLGYQLCTEATYRQIDGFFDQFKNPLIYTPGDNEWADCYLKDTQNTRQYTMTEIANYRINRLSEIRKRYFSTNKSLGKNKLNLIRQSENEKFVKFIENSYWIHGDVLFATAHIVGSNDSLHPYELELIHESVERRHANFWWITHMAEIAKKNKVKAIVIATHAEMFERAPAPNHQQGISGTQIKGGSLGPYVGYIYALSQLTAQFLKPILLIHGDAHRFVIDRPLLIAGDKDDTESLHYDNLIRLQTFGAPEVKDIKISVDTTSESVFGFSPIY